MVNLPDDVVDRLPKPPGFDRLPQEVKDALKAIHRDKVSFYFFVLTKHL